MPSADYPLPWVQKGLREGKSAAQSLREYREAGGSIRTQTFQRAYAEARRNMADSLDESGRPHNRRPQPGEVTEISTKRYNGFIQQVDVYVRDRETGLVETRPFAWRTQVLITRGAAIREALAAFNEGATGSPDVYNEEILGATYSSTLKFTAREME